MLLLSHVTGRRHRHAGRARAMSAERVRFEPVSLNPARRHRDAFAGYDVVALMLTGGGKSICFQLPAMMRPGTTVVFSPLLALVQYGACASKQAD